MKTTIIKGSTRRGQELIKRAETDLGRSLYNVYTTFSQKKAEAYEDCLREKVEDDGDNFRIISASGYKFSVAWEFVFEGHEATKIRTASNTYVVLLDE